MIITRTPFRVSFLGGGTDLPVVYRQIGGAVLSTTIDKYMYVAVNRRFEETIRVAYTRTEIVKSPEELRHDIVREALRTVGIRKQIEVVTIADVPAGTGLGSSSALTVGLLNALYAYLGIEADPERLAKEACELEIVQLGHRIGKQDQYAAAYGGLNFIQFLPDERVRVEPVRLAEDLREEFFARIRVFYTGRKRRAGDILSEQNRTAAEKLPLYRTLKDLAYAGKEALQAGDLNRFGKLLHEGWEIKRSFSRKISNRVIDELYDLGRGEGALGGKVLGAGGGGFILFFCKSPESAAALRHKFETLGIRELKIDYEPHGSAIIYASPTDSIGRSASVKKASEGA